MITEADIKEAIKEVEKYPGTWRKGQLFVSHTADGFSIANTVIPKSTFVQGKKDLQSILERYVAGNNAIMREVSIAQKKGWVMHPRNYGMLKIGEEIVTRGGETRTRGKYLSCYFKGTGKVLIDKDGETKIVKIADLPATKDFEKTKKSVQKKEATTTKEQVEVAQAKRKLQAQISDVQKESKKVLSPGAAGKWLKHPDRYDVRGVDTPDVLSTPENIRRIRDTKPYHLMKQLGIGPKTAFNYYAIAFGSSPYTLKQLKRIYARIYGYRQRHQVSPTQAVRQLVKE